MKFHIQYAQLNEKVSGQPDASITHQLNNFKKGMENEYCSLDYLVQMITQQKDVSSTARLNDDQIPRIVLVEFIVYLFELFYKIE